MSEGWLKEKSPFIIASAFLGFLMLIFLLLPIINTVAIVLKQEKPYSQVFTRLS